VAQQIFGILESQIETKQIFIVARVLTSLWCCRLRVDNIYKPVMIKKKLVSRCTNKLPMKRPFPLWIFLKISKYHWWKLYYFGCS
jgi:hypothetical protein